MSAPLTRGHLEASCRLVTPDPGTSKLRMSVRMSLCRSPQRPAWPHGRRHGHIRPRCRLLPLARLAPAASSPSTSSTCRRRPRPGSSPGSRPAHLASSARAPSRGVRATFIQPCSPPAASLATQSPPAARATAGPRVSFLCRSPDSSPLLSHGRLWLCKCFWSSEAGVATDKSQNQEWPFAAVWESPAVELTWHDVLAAAREPAFSARSRTVLCVRRRRLPLHSHLQELEGARHCHA